MSNELLKETIKKENPVRVFQKYLESAKEQIKMALPKHLSVERMIRIACTEYSKNKDLLQCDKASIYQSIIQAAQLGLEVGILGQAYLIPFKNNKTQKMECQFIPGYKGLLSLARRSGEITSLETNIVYENDHFEITLGIENKIEHKPFLEGDRGEIKLVYGVAKFKDGGHHFEWMTISDIEKIKRKSKSAGSAYSPWTTDYSQMIRKTLIRRMMNYLPMSIELGNAIQVSDAVESGQKAVIEGDFVVTESNEQTEETKPETQGEAKWVIKNAKTF